jgi:hypothetical protein
MCMPNTVKYSNLLEDIKNIKNTIYNEVKKSPTHKFVITTPTQPTVNLLPLL